MINIGGYRVIFSSSLLVPEGEIVYLDFKDEFEDETKLKLVFEHTEKKSGGNEKPGPALSIQDAEGIGEIKFINWGDGFGNSTKSPIAFANGPNNIELFLMANVTKLGTIYRVEFQVMTRVKK